jgi:uncharacterized membrane protein required for colicin V production
VECNRTPVAFTPRIVAEYGPMGVVGWMPQDPPAAAASTDLLQQVQLIGWVDRTALAVLLVFFILGLFKGLIWQVSRVAILLAAYVVAGRFGGGLAALIGSAKHPNPANPADPAAADLPDTTLYLAYCLVFVVVLVAMSLLAMLLQRLATKAGLGFFDRVGGGVAGVATGACVVLFGLSVVHMFFRESPLAAAAETSHSLRLSKRAINWFGATVPDDIRAVFALPPLKPPPKTGNTPLEHGAVPGGTLPGGTLPGGAPPAQVSNGGKKQSH